jgi:hypothetical protein
VLFQGACQREDWRKSTRKYANFLTWGMEACKVRIPVHTDNRDLPPKRKEISESERSIDEDGKFLEALQELNVRRKADAARDEKIAKRLTQREVSVFL